MDVISDHLHTAPVPPRWNYPNTEGYPIQGMRLWETIRKNEDVTPRLDHYRRHTTSSADALHYLEIMTDQFNHRAIYPGNRKGTRMFTPSSTEYRAMTEHHLLDEYLNAKDWVEDHFREFTRCWRDYKIRRHCYVSRIAPNRTNYGILVRLWTHATKRVLIALLMIGQ